MPRPAPPVPAALARVAGRQEGLVSAAQCREHGVTRSQVAGHVRRKAWDVVAPTVYDVGPPSPGGRHPHDRARRRAAVVGLLAHPGAVATGVCALVLRGVQGAPTVVEPEVTFPDGLSRRARPPVRLRRIVLERWDEIDGFACATVPDAFAQAVPDLDRRHAVALMDSALHRRDVTADGLAQAHDRARTHRGVMRTHSWWGEADGRAESPAETWARLSCADAGFAPDTLQLLVADGRGRPFARVDLAWRLPDGTALLVEIDGRDVHSTPEAVYADRERQNRIVTRRTLVRRFTGADAWSGRVASDVARLLTDAGWRPHPLPHDAVLRLDG
ncbi:type IV toxin-antitoxin system AbiEi family antitoxin domain-containing protein [Promicromonospora sp. Marseille-Q5078]